MKHVPILPDCRINFRKLSFLFLLFIVISPLASQSLASHKLYGNMPLAHHLIILTNKDSVSHVGLEIASIRKRIASHPDSLPIFNLSDRWKLVYYQTEGWKEVGRNKTQTHMTCICRHIDETYSVGDIFKTFGLPDTLFKKSAPLSVMPSAFERNDPFNGIWTPVYATRDYLIMRCVESYPYGNLTSWYYETIYYFKKAD